MTNCIVTKLKGIVQNDALSKLGECEWEVYWRTDMANKTRIVPINNASIIVTNTHKNSGKLLSNGVEVDSVTLTTSSNNFVVSNSPILKIMSKYDIKELQGVTAKTDDMVYMPNLEKFAIAYTSGDINVLNGKVGLKIFIPYYVVSFSKYAELITSLPDVTNIGFYVCEESVTALQLGTLYKNGIGHLFICNNCSGSIEDMVSVFRGVAATGTITTEWQNSSAVTFNEESIGVGGRLVTLSWTASTITFDGVTITA